MAWIFQLLLLHTQRWWDHISAGEPLPIVPMFGAATVYDSEITILSIDIVLRGSCYAANVEVEGLERDVGSYHNLEFSL